ncbi:relaxase/mobilization nuclease domain-containing protein [[Clostridium] innocuum]|nr:relaxase/mobilization nuclease domain-containing protein [[Clostridium] innocuum]
MATTRIMPLHIGKGRTESRAISDIIDYVANPQKTDNGKLITGYSCDSRTADAEFLLAKRQYISATGRVRGADDVIAYHVRQSFKPGEITPEEANRLGVEFAKRFTKGNHAFVVCTHIDKSHVHNHIIWSAVNADCDRKFRNFWGSTRAVRRLSDTICIENGLSIVEDPKPHGKSYNKWLGEQANPSHREQLRVMIDRALEQKPADFDALLKLLTEMGCEVSRRGKAIRLKAPGWKNVARMDDKLGAGYSEAEIRAVLAGEKRHTPRKNSAVQPEPPKVNLLVDIQAKLQAGKGAGYARWAKVFNLKQMAQTMNYLSENNLLEYAVLEEKAAAATAHHNDLSAQIKAAEKRMAEIAVLRTHIVNYAKTREAYVAYRKAGYSKKFREEHEEEILLHQAAKNAFDEMGVKKLPKVKELQTEYAKLLEEKKKTYAEYRRSREEMRELLTAKVNVDRVLKMEVEQDVEKEKDQDQR